MPAEVLQVACYAFQAEVPASCQQHNPVLTETERVNTGGYYPQGFYVVMGSLAGPSLDQSVFLMRLLNSLIYVLSLTALLSLARPSARSSYVLGSLVTLVPLGMFIVASVNPSSWALTAATVLWASLVELVRADSRRNRVGLAVLSLVAIVLAFSSRADAAIYAAMSIGLAWLVTAKRDRQTLVRGVVAGVLMIGCLAYSRLFGSTQGLESGPVAIQEEPVDAWFERIRNVPNLFAGVFGTWSLGWLDTPVPPLTWVLALGVFAAVVFWGLRRCGWRKALALLGILAVACAFPIVIATLKHLFVQQAIQPRYFFPMIILAAMIAVSEENDEGPRLNLAQAGVIAVLLGFANAAALHQNLRRYLTGIADPRFNLNLEPSWWWAASPLSPMWVWGTGAVVFLAAALVAVCYRDALVASISSRTGGARFSPEPGPPAEGSPVLDSASTPAPDPAVASESA